MPLINQAGEIISRTYRIHANLSNQDGWNMTLRDLGRDSKCRYSGPASGNLKSSDIHAIGITNQRETTVVWDRETGMPIGSAIVGIAVAPLPYVKK